MGKTSVYRSVRAAAERMPEMKQHSILKGYQMKPVGADVTSVRCNGQWIPLAIAVDETNGMTLSFDLLPGEEAEQIQA